MVTMVKPDARKLDEDVCELIGRHVAAHHLRAEKLHYAITGSTEPVHEERQATVDISDLMAMAQPDLDGDEQAAIDRLRAALEARETRAHR